MPRKAKSEVNGSATAEIKEEKQRAKPKAKKSAGVRQTTVRAPKMKESREVTDEAIRLRAYFISQDRRRHGMSSDPNSDWIEARRQLLQEAVK